MPQERPKQLDSPLLPKIFKYMGKAHVWVYRRTGGRVGGKWRFVNRHPKGEAAFHGEYREIAPPSRLVFTEIFEEFPDSVSVVTTEFTDEGGKTRFTATVRYPSLEVRDMVIASGMSRGAAISYDRLDDLVTALQQRS